MITSNPNRSVVCMGKKDFQGCASLGIWLCLLGSVWIWSWIFPEMAKICREKPSLLCGSHYLIHTYIHVWNTSINYRPISQKVCQRRNEDVIFWECCVLSMQCMTLIAKTLVLKHAILLAWAVSMYLLFLQYYHHQHNHHQHHRWC